MSTRLLPAKLTTLVATAATSALSLAPDAPVVERDVRRMTAERVSASRTYGSETASAFDALLVRRLLGEAPEPRFEELKATWAEFIDAAGARYVPNPAVFHPLQPARSAALRTVFASMRAYFRVDAYWCERSGIPRRWLLEAKSGKSVRVAQYIATRIGGFRPLWFTHLPPLPPGEHLTEAVYSRVHLEIARALQYAPDIRGVVSSSWYYDPDLARVSPHLAHIPAMLARNDCLCFEISQDGSLGEAALGTSRTRRDAFARGEYTPRTFARLWGRNAILRWAEREPGWQMALAVEDSKGRRRA